MNHAQSSIPRFIKLFALAAVLLGSSLRAAGEPLPPVKVILWFDTEDYMLPADDDAAKRLAEMLTERHIRATFKVVGEKARVLEKRGRHDVIDALRHHDIGYHTNFHSVHPAPAEYLNHFGLVDGVDEFVRREARGAADVRRIFNVPFLVCYGQPGSSWASQAVAGLSRCGIANDGIPCYVDSGSHVGLGGKPYWYCGAINVYDMRGHETRMGLWDPAEPKDGMHRFDQMAKQVVAEGGGLISIYYHPCEWVHMEFWDKVNFARGANPPREQWKPERQRTPEETEAAFGRFGQYLDHICSLSNVCFVTASQLPVLYRDRLQKDGASVEEVMELSRRITAPDSKGITFQTIGNKSFSPSDQFALFCGYLERHVISKGDEAAAAEEPLRVPKLLLGPDAEPPAGAVKLDPLTWFAFRDATRDAGDFVQTQHRIPSRVFVGADAVAPADFLHAMASTCIAYHEKHQFPETIAVGSGIKLLTTQYVVQDSPKVYGGWIIHREKFQAPHVLDIARLQTWTLKPTIPSN